MHLRHLGPPHGAAAKYGQATLFLLCVKWRSTEDLEVDAVLLLLVNPRTTTNSVAQIMRALAIKIISCLYRCIFYDLLVNSK
jgi:hypothetical protein